MFGFDDPEQKYNKKLKKEAYEALILLEKLHRNPVENSIFQSIVSNAINIPIILSSKLPPVNGVKLISPNDYDYSKDKNINVALAVFSSFFLLTFIEMCKNKKEFKAKKPADEKLFETLALITKFPGIENFNEFKETFMNFNGDSDKIYSFFTATSLPFMFSNAKTNDLLGKLDQDPLVSKTIIMGFMTVFAEFGQQINGILT